MCSLRKIIMRLRGTKFCTSSTRFAPSFVRQPNGPYAPKRYKTHQNVSLESNGVDWVCSLRKIMTQLRGTNFCTSSARFETSFVRQPNGPECFQMERNAPKHQLQVQWGGSGAFLAENSDATLCTNFCTSSAHFAPSFITHPNGPQCTQIEQNAPKTLV